MCRWWNNLLAGGAVCVAGGVVCAAGGAIFAAGGATMGSWWSLLCSS